MRYSGYGLGILSPPALFSHRGACVDAAPPDAMGNQADRPSRSVPLPAGLTAGEAAFLLGVFARLKQKRFGRLEVTVSDGRLVDIALVEKVDRNLFRSLSS